MMLIEIASGISVNPAHVAAVEDTTGFSLNPVTTITLESGKTKHVGASYEDVMAALIRAGS